MLVVCGFDDGSQGTSLICWKVRGVDEINDFVPKKKMALFLTVKCCGFHVFRTVVDLGNLYIGVNLFAS